MPSRTELNLVSLSLKSEFGAKNSETVGSQFLSLHGFYLDQLSPRTNQGTFTDAALDSDPVAPASAVPSPAT
jgi:hypothetical protein